MKPVLSFLTLLFSCAVSWAGVKTWDGRHDTSNIEVTVVYFVPSDRKPLVDWRDRVDYFCKRIELFHAREFQGQSTMKTVVHPEPLISESTTAQLRIGDPNKIYSRTLNEADRRLKFASDKKDAFPILLVLSEINWRPLDDFYRLHPGDDGKPVFEGIFRDQLHFPGAKSGGSRAAYLADRGVGRGLVSADGWRVPYRGSDNVIYHEGCGHTVGLPHPEPQNGSVMSLAQYRGWLSESWLDKEQKVRLGWEPGEDRSDLQMKLFTEFDAVPVPRVPKPQEATQLELSWPENVSVRELRVRYQTAVDGPWVNVPQQWEGDAPATAMVGSFDRETPVSFRIDATLKDGETAELWGYFQVRRDPEQMLLPRTLSADLAGLAGQTELPIQSWPENEVDLLKLADPATCWTVGDWTRDGSGLVSPKVYGARLQLPYSPPEEYRLTLIVEPLDKPNGLILGQRSGKNRFVALVNHAHRQRDIHRSALENVDGQNVGNETTFEASVFRQNQLSQVVVTVRRDNVAVSVDGHRIISWNGSADRLSLSDYWKTPDETCLFLGTYDCSYRFHRVTLQPISGQGEVKSSE